MFTHTLSGHWPVYPYNDNDIKVQLNLSRLKTIPFIIDIFISIAGGGQEQTKCLLAHSELPAGVRLSQKLDFCICLSHCSLFPSLF